MVDFEDPDRYGGRLSDANLLHVVEEIRAARAYPVDGRRFVAEIVTRFRERKSIPADVQMFLADVLSAALLSEMKKLNDSLQLIGHQHDHRERDARIACHVIRHIASGVTLERAVIHVEVEISEGKLDFPSLTSDTIKKIFNKNQAEGFDVYRISELGDDGEAALKRRARLAEYFGDRDWFKPVTQRRLGLDVAAALLENEGFVKGTNSGSS